MEAKITAKGKVRITMTREQARSLSTLLNSSGRAVPNSVVDRIGFPGYTEEDEHSMATPLHSALYDLGIRTK